MRFSGPWASNNLNNENKSKKNLKKASFVKKKAKSHDGKKKMKKKIQLETKQ